MNANSLSPISRPDAIPTGLVRVPLTDPRIARYFELRAALDEVRSSAAPVASASPSRWDRSRMTALGIVGAVTLGVFVGCIVSEEILESVAEFAGGALLTVTTCTILTGLETAYRWFQGNR